MFKKYEVGEFYEEAIGHPEGCYFDITDEGAEMIVYFNSPTPKEIENFKSQNRFEMRLIVLSWIMVFVVKFGSLNWMDSPYTPHLSKRLSGPIPEAHDGKGLSLTVMLFDSATGKLKSFRLISLSEKFTNTIKKESDKLLRGNFDKREYEQSIALLFAKYSTKALVNMTNPGFKIN